ncbi:MAG: cytochrome c [Anaerolineae bacterium]|nr:cytochrome c [Anaerolineae bacterium]
MKPFNTSISLPNQLIVYGFLLFAFMLSGCNTTTDQQPIEPPSTSTATDQPTESPPTLTPTDRPLPSPTATLEPSPTAAVVATATLTPTATTAAAPVAVTETAKDNAPSLDTSDVVAAGLQVYKAQYCGICHKLDVAGTGGIFGPEQNHIGTTAETRIKNPNYRGHATTAADYLRESILEPGAYFVEGFEQSAHQMPPYTHLSDTQVDALVLMLLQQK